MPVASLPCPGGMPTHLTKKWVREVHLTIPGATASIINHYSELARIAIAPEGEWS